MRKVIFIDMVIYSSAIDLYVEENSSEQKYRIHNSQKNFLNILNQLSDTSVDEGPPALDRALIGKPICLRLNDSSNVINLNLLEFNTDSC